ncbi:alpha/beta hydrolase [Ignavibacteria bacterium CHB1]|jgi:Dipeptidyl aminopeptidases/acylaminoacyl-peptidases|nr:MAG: alpha/beta hydrolase [Chlorobiota bacterium]KXK06319.1 MAG: alpha/beta superfamily hydrolase [Chlorobi bacterium OLB4]MBV6399168.1 hypothetical protein [Ignavibacteria bacterium]MCC6885385.1 alpha/beta hydrolase [Ignavibacteriales bacterium]MCE7953628.1 alpha/beta hydrolase [Chlorobi bacterium CHB7]MDL1887482.1 alpha/beta hydrolase [Ignavibacteria bacterium CHB1]OQY78369.1 MAG: hypothetical protein B6D43_02585 [Ignavibacteriales bacterium UTCHB1]RIK49187.1 MAG: alpha/beta hydrolase [
MELFNKEYEFVNITGEKLFSNIRFIKNNKKKPLVIFAHGFKGFKDWGGFPYMLETLARAELVSAAFNFSHNGTGDTNDTMSDFTRLDMFAKNTFSIELSDLNSFIGSLIQISDEIEADTGNITLIGHSRGGGTVILQAATDKRIKKLITLASVSNFDRYSENHKSLWKEKGYFEVLNTRTNQLMRINVSLLEDIENNRDRLDIEKAAENINIPWLIIHGSEDLAVDVSDAENLKSLNNRNSTRLEIFKNTGHTFGVVHPFNGSNNTFDEVIQLMINFITGTEL